MLLIAFVALLVMTCLQRDLGLRTDASQIIALRFRAFSSSTHSVAALVLALVLSCSSDWPPITARSRNLSSLSIPPPAYPRRSLSHTMPSCQPIALSRTLTALSWLTTRRSMISVAATLTSRVQITSI